MPSLKLAIAGGIQRNAIPSADQRSVRALSRDLQMKPPISLADMMNDLNPDSITHRVGPWASGPLYASATISLQNNGLGTFVGSVHDQSGVFSTNWFFAVAFIDAKDVNGGVITFGYSGNVGGTLAPGVPRDDAWSAVYDAAVIRQNWNAIKSSRAEFRFHTSTNAGLTIGNMFEDIGIVVVALVAAVVGGSAAAGVRCEGGGDDGWTCFRGASTVNGGDGGGG